MGTPPIRPGALSLCLLMAGCAATAEPPAGADMVLPEVGVATGTAVSDDSSRIAWLREHAAPLRTVDPADEDFSDLAPIGRSIGDARIVFVGEPSHTTGTLFSAQARLVKYLHRDLGFDVVVFEAGLYDGSKVWEAIQAGEPAQQAFRLGIPPVWSDPEEVRPLMDYIAAHARTDRPLELAGYDSQFTGSVSYRHLVPELQAWLESAGIGNDFAGDTVLWSGFRRIHHLSIVREDSAGRTYVRPDSAEIAPFLARLPHLREAVATRAVDGRARFWLQVLESVDAFARQVALMTADPNREAPLSFMNLRDEQGGRNLLWLASDHYRGKKLVVVLATIHAARNLHRVEWEWTDYRPTGHHVWQALGSQAYTLGLVALEGESGWSGDQRWPIIADQRPELELEEMLAAAGFDLAFLDYRAIPPGGEWLRGPLVSRPFGNIAALADTWTDVIDGLVFVRRGTAPDWADEAP
jgi:erythromycin esterase